MRGLLTLVVMMVVLPACSLVDEDAGSAFEDVTLVNRAGELLYFTAVELEASHLMDPVTHFDPKEEHRLSAVDPGDQAAVKVIAGYEPGDDVRFFLYALRQMEGVELAVFVETLTASDTKLRQNGGKVVITGL